jgi:hypothetical protein
MRQFVYCSQNEHMVREYKEDQSPNIGDFLIKCIAGTQRGGFTAQKQ